MRNALGIEEPTHDAHAPDVERLEGEIRILRQQHQTRIEELQQAHTREVSVLHASLNALSSRVDHMCPKHEFLEERRAREIATTTSEARFERLCKYNETRRL